MGIHKKYKSRQLLAKKNFLKKKFSVFLLSGIVFSLLAISLATYQVAYGNKKDQRVLGATVNSIKREVKKIEIPTVTISLPTSTPSVKSPQDKEVVQSRSTSIAAPPPATPTTIDKSAQYTGEKIGESTWRITNVQNDTTMASTQDILNALNSYRGAHGISNLSWDQKLADLAQSRANKFNADNSLDSHAGFRSFMDSGGFDTAGFNSLGENSAMLSGNMNGERIIKNIFGADASHDENQLDNWTHVGIGLNGVAVNVNFGKDKK